MGSYHATLPNRISPATVDLPADSVAAVELQFHRLIGYRSEPLGDQDRADGMRLYERTLALLEQTPRAQRSYVFRTRRTGEDNPGHGKNPFTGEAARWPGWTTRRRWGVEYHLEDEQNALLAVIEKHPWDPERFPQRERAKAVHLWVLIQTCLERATDYVIPRSPGGLIAGSLRAIRGKFQIPKEALPLARHVTLLMRLLGALLRRFAVPRPAPPPETGHRTGALLHEQREQQNQNRKFLSKEDRISLNEKKDRALAELAALFPDWAKARAG